ncbi:MAG TPA: SMR family transporter [Limnobacter sp.]|uniref:SMR family transporter n=1 Tax=Limnobacter sp. TaxID=2003368 RepID=UPI002ED7EB6B
MTLHAFGLVITGVLLNAVAQFLLKMATNKVGVIEVSSAVSLSALSALFFQWPMVLGLLCYGVSLLVWLMALSRVDVTLAYPMLAIGYVVNAVAAQYYLGEVVSLQRWLAIGIILVGVALLARS